MMVALDNRGIRVETANNEKKIMINNRIMKNPPPFAKKVALGNRGMTVKAERQCGKDRKECRALVHM